MVSVEEGWLLVCCAYVPDAWRLEIPLHRHTVASFLALWAPFPEAN